MHDVFRHFVYFLFLQMYKQKIDTMGIYIIAQAIAFAIEDILSSNSYMKNINKLINNKQPQPTQWK